MAEEPDIIYSNTPVLLNLSFGKNIFSFYDQNTTGLKCGIQIWDRTLTTKYGTFEAYPNTSGYYHFDLQNLLKNFTTPNYNPFGTLFSTSDNESFEFKVKYGYVNAAGSFTEQGTYPSATEDENCVVLGGRKRYDDLNWNNRDNYVSAVLGFGGCPGTTRFSQALTDWNEPTPLSKLKGTIPDYVSDNFTEVYEIPTRLDDKNTISFYNFFDENPTFPLPTGCKNIKAVRFDFYGSNGNLINTLFKSNVTGSGGGPGSSIALDYDLVYPYNAISVNLSRQYFSTEYNSEPKYVYVSCYTYKGDGGCIATQTSYSNNPVSKVYRFNFEEDKCNDYPPVQVSWLNSFGFRDYFFFSKRTDETINIKRNTYEQVEGNWNGVTFDVNSYDRGEKVYSQDLTIEKTINTRYLSDYEARVLKNLYISPDVMVRYDGETEWIPIVITDSSWTEKTRRKDRLYQNTLTYREAHKINSQRG